MNEIIEGDHPGSTYYAAELRNDIDDANKVATEMELRGHSSLFAALDAAVEVTRDGDRREWRVAKSKDGQDGDAQALIDRLVITGLCALQWKPPALYGSDRRLDAA